MNSLTKNNIAYCTKESLYQYVNELKHCMGIDHKEIGIKFYDKCKMLQKLKIELVDFKEKTLRGMSWPNDYIILLNSSRSCVERNFDCAHEFIHVVKHRHENFQTFNCFDTLRPNQNLFLEWQANEGAAEMLVPYKIFIPKFCKNVKNCNDIFEYCNLKQHLANYFKVPLTVIDLRIENLKYEIQQYENGCSINKLHILSNAQQIKNKISVVSYNVKFDFCDSII